MRSPATRSLTTCAIAGLAILGATACLPEPTEPVGPSGARLVAVAGDSLVHRAENGPGLEDPEGDQFLTDALLAEGNRVTISTMVGATALDLDGVTWPEDPDVLVIALGTNDMREGRRTLEEALADLDEHLARWPDACHVLVTVVETAPWQLDVHAPAWNAALAERADVLVDWATTVQPEWLEADGVHHTADGSEAYRSAIVEGTGGCPA